MFELRHLIDVIKYDKLAYIEQHKEIFDKMDVVTQLNKRVVVLRQELVNDPDNKNLSFELQFCENEIERIEEEINEFFSENDALKFDIDNSRKLIDFNFNELHQYVDLLEKYSEFNVEESLVEAFRTSLNELEVNVEEYVKLCSKSDD
ncbi:MAG: hypothetical protein IJJ11_06595 [Methanosphaera sp.]|uniref:hypothetical protein n=1 Tax=Methanosphaera sp. BMS TaxID=1789762 RepID=UPI000DC1E14F|nr:hypothetical protein [Methanosphaera sp. BMS]AWX32155.1 hypothetical protein AW729_03145 [Methanosphaera sp. BMS]MBQ6444329.1 hypothetical protein [Methanosphaera sp.]